VAAGIDPLVGRGPELALALAVLRGGRHLLLEGPAGVGKTRLALAACAALGRGAVRVDGDDRHSEARLVGWFDPPAVLRAGYGPQSFTPGPLVEAMRAGSVLFVNELNRMPEAVQNVLLPALDEGRVGVPHVGEVRAAPGFAVVATQNPVEYVATGHLSEALRDRFEHVALAWQPEAEERAIVAAEAGAPPALAAWAVRLARASRSHPAVRRGASVRAASAAAGLALALSPRPGPAERRAAAAAALRTRLDLRDDAGAAGFGAVLADLLAAAEAPGEGGPIEIGPNGGDRDVDLVPALEDALREMLPLGPPEVAPPRIDPDEELRAANLPEDGWRLAASLAAGDLRWMDDDVKRHAKRLAAAAVLQRAQRLVGPLRGPTRLERGPQLAPDDGELDIEATLDNLVGKAYAEADDIVVERRVEQRRQVVLMVDTSGSMAGENMALAAVAAAVLALKMHPGDLAIVAFSADARHIVGIGEQPPVREIVRRLLDRPCAGPTNIAAGLEAGAEQLALGRDPRRSAVLISDGQYTVGHDPRKAAARFPSLHVLHTLAAERTARPVGFWITPLRQVGADVARVGSGRLIPVRSFEELPRRMLDVADMVLR